MDELISIYRLVDGVQTTVCSISKENASLNQGIMDKDKVTLSVVTEDPIYLTEGDYILLGDVKYKINRDPEDKQKSEKEHSYEISLEAPIYTLIDKVYCNKITGSTTFSLTGKLRDFLELLIWNINVDNNSLGVDTGWTIGLCPDTDYLNITFDSVKCRDILDTLASKFGLEYYATNKTINYVSRIENETGLVFTQGQGGGLYEVERKNVDDGDLVTRVYPKGGTENVIPGEGDFEGRLMLPEGYIENFSESKRGVEAVVIFDGIHPTFQGSVGTVSGDNNREFLCPGIDFNIADVAVGDEGRINFLTGDLMGRSFEFKWDNNLKKITLIYQEDNLAEIDPNTGSRPNIPSASKYLRGGELFNFTGLKLSGTYKTNAITKLRQKATEWLAYYCRKRVKFELTVDYRYIRQNNVELHCGDLITINVPLHNITKLIRITSIEKNLHTGKLTCTVSNYLDEKWRDKIEEQIVEIKSSTATVNGGYGGATSVTILEKNDEREPSDSNVMSALRTLKEIGLNNEVLKDIFLRKDQPDTAAELITFINGLKSLSPIEVGEVIDSMLAGRGTLITPDKIQTPRLEVRDALVVMELIFNRLEAVEGDQVYTEAGTIERMDDLGNNTYRLIMKKRWENDFTAFEEDDIVRGRVNTLLSDGLYYTSFMRVLSKNVNDNAITVVMYAGSEVPGGVNHPPCEMMKIHRWGNTDELKPKRQRCWYLSSTEGRLLYLAHVNKPILEDYMYSSFHGLPVELDLLKNLPINYDEPYFYARGAIIQNLLRVDMSGKPIYEITDRGEWSADIAAGDDPYLFEAKRSSTGLFETHDVWREGVRYRCLRSGTTQEPRWNASDWDDKGGNKQYIVEFTNKTGSRSYRNGDVDDEFTAHVLFSGREITDILMSTPGTEIQWVRDTGNAPADNTWMPTYVDGKKNVIKLVKADMGTDWMTVRKAKFICRIFVPVGDIHTEVASNYIGYNI